MVDDDEVSASEALAILEGGSDDPELQQLAREFAAIADHTPIVEGQWFHRQTVPIDGRTFKRCRFDHCELITEKGTFVFDNCVLWQCHYWINDDAGKVASFFSHSLLVSGLITAPNFMKLPSALRPLLARDNVITIPNVGT